MISTSTLETEVKGAPEAVRLIFQSIPLGHRELIPLSREIHDLAEAYMTAGVVGRRWSEDCLHVASATICRADAIVSWNFKHIVRLDRIRGFNAVNLAEGYGMIAIISPKEVNFDE